jgi:hypothetical protein
LLQEGRSQLVVRASDGLPMRIPRSWTDVDGARVSEPGVACAFTRDGLRELIELVDVLRKRG